MILKPQKGPQEEFLSSSADIVVYGGAAGGGKTYWLLLETLRNTENPKFSALIFRQNSKQILATGGLWDKSQEVYILVGAEPFKASNPRWIFPSGYSVSFNHLQLEKDVFSWQGAEIPLICFDELTHFSDRQCLRMM